MDYLNDHKGTYRHERFPKALDPDYFKLDERSANDIVKQTAVLASCIKYYNEQHLEDGNWEAFFEDVYDYVNHEVDFRKIDEWEKNAQAPPHLALYFAFVEIFKIAQDELNRFTQRHLEYYYKNILGFESNVAVADKVHLFFKIDKKENKTLIPKGTLFEGGDDKNKKKRLYASDFDLSVNKSEIKQVRTLTIKKDNDHLDFTTQDDILTDTAFRRANIGFAISSPMLYLKDGDRNVKIEFGDKEKARLVNKYANIEYSSPTGWQPVPMKYLSNVWKLFIEVPKALPPFAKYDESVHQMHIEAKDPVIRFVFSKEKPVSKEDGAALFALNVKELISSIRVDVEHSKDLLLYNDFGRLSNDVPFMPFGPNPISRSSRFLMGNNKIFNKYLKSFDVNVEWKGFPEDIGKYYQTYKDGWALLSEDQRNLYGSFKVDKFSKFDKLKLPGRLLYLNDGNWSDELAFTNQGDSIREMVSEYTCQTKSGFVQYVSSLDYGHAIFSTLLGKVMLANAKMPVAENQKTVPEKPYTPEIQSLSVNYTLSGQFNLQEHQLFSIHPFRNVEIDRADGKLFQTLASGKSSAQMINEKCYYFAVANAPSDSEVSVYFDIFNSNPFDDDNRYFWSYFNGREWVLFGNNMIVRDTTSSFSKSGILSFIIPREALFADDILVWIGLLIQGKGKSFPEILQVRTNCVTATFKDNDNELSHLIKGLPSGLIRKFVEKNPKIKSVEQPYPSFGGKEAENDKDFYTRISERLRHKNRASSSWDYEHLVLEAFPQISFALCMAHSRIVNENGETAEPEFAPGNVLLLLSPNTGVLMQENPLEPVVPMQLLNEIRNYLKSLASPHADIQVLNFSYKPIKVKCKVQLRKGFSDISFYRDKLNADLIDFISPWVSPSNDKYRKSLIYSSKNVADIYFFLENLEYVDFVVSADIEAGGKVYSISDHTIDKKQYEIFTSVMNHDITIVYNGQ